MSEVTQYSRRHILRGGAAAVAVSIPLVCATGQSFARQQPKSASGNHVDVLTSTMPGFRQKVESLYPGLTGDTRFRQLYPLAALVHVSQEVAVRAATLVWTLTTPDGTVTTPVFFSAPPGSPRGVGKSRTVVTAQVDIMEEGSYKLFTPYFSWSPALYAQIAPTWPSVVQHNMPANFLATQAGNATAISIVLDAAIFNNRTLTGPDVFHLGDRVRVRRNAEHDEARVVSNMLKSGASNEIVLDYLTARSTTSRPDGSGAKRWYRFARKQQAQRLLRKKTNLNAETFEKHILRTIAIKKTLFQRLPAES